MKAPGFGDRRKAMLQDIAVLTGGQGAILFLLVDKYEPDGLMARLLKFLVLFVAAVAIMHKLQPFGLSLF